MKDKKSVQDPKRKDPRKQGVKPRFSQNKIKAPGLEHEMSPKADHGEESYEGLGRLKDRAALITGGEDRKSVV